MVWTIREIQTRSFVRDPSRSRGNLFYETLRNELRERFYHNPGHPNDTKWRREEFARCYFLVKQTNKQTKFYKSYHDYL